MNKKNGKIITVFSTKGGVGKTIFTINLAATYYLLGKRVLIIDLDVYSGGIGLALNVDETKDIYSLVNDINNNHFSELSDYVASYNDHIDVLSCPVDPRSGGKIDRQQVEGILMNAIDKYDVILVDTTHVLSDLNLTALDIADQIILLLSNDPIDIKNMKSVIAILKDSNINNYKVVLNDAINTDRDFFSLFEIKNLINNNIDYTIEKSFHMSDMDYYTIKGQICLLNPKVRIKKKSDIRRFEQIATSLIEEKKEGHKHE